MSTDHGTKVVPTLTIAILEGTSTWIRMLPSVINRQQLHISLRILVDSRWDFLWHGMDCLPSRFPWIQVERNTSKWNQQERVCTLPSILWFHVGPREATRLFAFMVSFYHLLKLLQVCNFACAESWTKSSPFHLREYNEITFNNQRVTLH